MATELIIIREYCQKTRIEPSFFLLLEESGLLDVSEQDNEKYFPASQLQDLERYARLYYDLSINIEGIDVINHLLNKMERMREEISELRNRLDFFDEM